MHEARHADFVVRVWRQSSCLGIKSKEPGLHDSNDDFNWISDLYPWGFYDFLEAKHIDFRGENLTNVNEESDRDLKDNENN